MTEAELPDWLFADPEVEAERLEQEMATKFGRNRRERGDIVYDDKMSDLQFMRSVEKGQTPGTDRASRKRVLERKIRETWRRVATYKDSDGRVLGSQFMRLPMKTREPEYFETISNPIALQKLATYTNVTEFVADFRRLFANIRTYHAADSEPAADGRELEEVFEKACDELLADDLAEDQGLERPKKPRKARSSDSLSSESDLGSISFASSDLEEQPETKRKSKASAQATKRLKTDNKDKKDKKTKKSKKDNGKSRKRADPSEPSTPKGTSLKIVLKRPILTD